MKHITHRTDGSNGTTYTITAHHAGLECDWCDGPTVAIVTNHYANGAVSRDWMCREHLAEYHPTLAV